MKTLITLFAVLLIATSAFAGVDPDPDGMGIYFDTSANVTCTQAAYLDHITAYIIYTNPTQSAVRGFECSIMMVGAMNTAITSTFPLPAINHGTFTGTLIVSYSNPLPTSQATVLATLDIFYLDFEPVDFYLGPSMPSDSSQGLPMVILDDYSFMDVHPSTVSTPAAEINDPACSVVEDRGTSFGLVKALFAR